MTARATRRQVCGASAAMLVVAVPSAALAGDADLLAACAEFHRADAARLAEDDRRGLTDERAEELDAAWDDAFEAVSAMQPTTQAGLAAQAAVAARGMRWLVKVSRTETWEQQADPYQRLAIDCLMRMAEGVA